MPEAGFRKEKEEIVLTISAYTAYSGSVRNITYIVRRSYAGFTLRRILEITLLAALGAILLAAACQGCMPPPAKPEKPIRRTDDTLVHTRLTIDEAGTRSIPNGKKAINSETDQGKLPCKCL